MSRPTDSNKWEWYNEIVATDDTLCQTLLESQHFGIVAVAGHGDC
jgi:hypothetical protein